MNVLVAGGAGYIGSHAVKQLVEAGHHAVVVDNLFRGHREAVPDAWHTIIPFALHVVNLANPAAVNRLLTSAAAAIADGE